MGRVDAFSRVGMRCVRDAHGLARGVCVCACVRACVRVDGRAVQLSVPAGQMQPQVAEKSEERTHESHWLSPLESDPLKVISLSLPWKRQWISL